MQHQLQLQHAQLAVNNTNVTDCGLLVRVNLHRVMVHMQNGSELMKLNKQTNNSLKPQLWLRQLLPAGL
jgi:hypothetical protein